MTLQNRQWVLVSRPSGSVKLSDFALRTDAMAEPDLAPGQILVRNLVFHLAPTMRNWMNDPKRSYRAAVGIGESIIGPGGGQVVRSNHPRWPVGTRLSFVSRWQNYTVLEPDRSPTPVIATPSSLSTMDALGALGLNSLTAYVGVINVGQPKPGETVVVSAAAGSVGSMAAQIAKVLGCRVVGLAGGQDKCRWLVDACGLDAAIDYKHENVSERLAALCPKGVDVFFDNVGGDMLHAVMDNVAPFARIAVCGQISAYDSNLPAPGPRDMMRIVYQRVRIQGFVLGDFPNDIEKARADLARWIAEGKIVHRADIRQGFENLPGAFLDLFRGQNEGTLLVKIAEAE
jgi:NADPH-dependent curcumin reductase CurA